MPPTAEVVYPSCGAVLPPFAGRRVRRLRSHIPEHLHGDVAAVGRGLVDTEVGNVAQVCGPVDVGCVHDEAVPMAAVHERFVKELERRTEDVETKGEAVLDDLTNQAR